MSLDSLLLNERHGQSLIKHSSGQELRPSGVLVDADGSKTSYDWQLIPATDGWFYLENRQDGMRLRQHPRSTATQMRMATAGNNAQ